MFDKNKINYTEELQITCKQMASCIDGAKFVPTKYGGVFYKGNRKIACEIDYKKQDYKDDFKIKKNGNIFGLKINKSSCKMYSSIKESIIKGLGIKE